MHAMSESIISCGAAGMTERKSGAHLALICVPEKEYTWSSTYCTIYSCHAAILLSVLSISALSSYPAHAAYAHSANSEETASVVSHAWLVVSFDCSLCTRRLPRKQTDEYYIDRAAMLLSARGSPAVLPSLHVYSRLWYGQVESLAPPGGDTLIVGRLR